MNSTAQRWLAGGLMVVSGMFAVVAVSNPEALGLPAVVLNWMVVVNAGIGVALNQLNRVQEVS